MTAPKPTREQVLSRAADALAEAIRKLAAKKAA